MKKETAEEMLLQAIYGYDEDYDLDPFCQYCFMTTADRVEFNGKPYHPECLSKMLEERR